MTFTGLWVLLTYRSQLALVCCYTPTRVCINKDTMDPHYRVRSHLPCQHGFAYEENNLTWFNHQNAPVLWCSVLVLTVKGRAFRVCMHIYICTLKLIRSKVQSLNPKPSGARKPILCSITLAVVSKNRGPPT